jgi:hypothetical protein
MNSITRYSSTSKLLLLFYAHSFVSGHISERLPFLNEDSIDCNLTISAVMMINCPSHHFLYQTEKFIETSNKGIEDFGEHSSMKSVHKTVDDSDLGHITYLDPSTNSVIKAYSTYTGIGQFTLMTYSFLSS